MTSKSVTKRNAAPTADLSTRIAALAKKLSCTVSGLFYKAGHKFLSHITTHHRIKEIKKAISLYYRTSRRKKGSPEAPSWLLNFMDYMSKKLNGADGPTRRSRRAIRRPQAAFAR